MDSVSSRSIFFLACFLSFFHSLIRSGNGTTSCVELLIDALGLKHHIAATGNTGDDDGANSNPNRPVIFVGPYEHHSNLLPWRELGQVDIEMVRLDPISGNMDLRHLEELLQLYTHRSIKIGAFSAASNVTGVIADDLAITALLHKYGALSIWDYATGASYLNVQMNPTHPDYTTTCDSTCSIAKDAVLLSGHKLLGGVGSPGVLIMKKHLISQQNPPCRSGGGTVFYVTDQHHRFLSNRIERFEGGTPNIVGIWRLGLAFAAKSQLQTQFQQQQQQQQAHNNGHTTTLLEYDLYRARRIQKQLSAIPNLALMDSAYYANGNDDDDDESNNNNNIYQKLPVFSFLIKCGTRFLHYNYVCALLNDLFGIQSRGGCQCAGPFAQYLLGLHGSVNAAVEECLVHTKDELLRPGFTRLSLPTFGTTDAIERYVVRAIAWVAQHGWKCMHVYRCNHRTGEWRHKSRPGAPLGKTERKWLSHYRTSLQQPQPTLQQPQARSGPSPVPTLEEALSTADKLLKIVVQDHSSLMQAVKMSHEENEDSSTLSSLRWYVYPKEVAVFLEQGMDHVPATMDRTAVSGAVRPVAWFPPPVPPVPAAAAAAVASTERNPSIRASTTTTTTIPDEPNNLVLLDTALDTANLQFRQGEHTGTAPLEEIQQGFEDGELTEACLIYQPSTDSWDAIANFLKGLTKPNSNSGLTSKAPAADDEKLTNDIPTTDQFSDLIPFRDGEHSGQASWEEIETGYEDGELSEACEIYDSKRGDWEKVDVVLRQRKPPAETNTVPETKKTAVIVPSDVPVLEKNEKKKPQRDSAAWGQGSMVPIQPPPTTQTESQDSRPAKGKRHKHVKPPAKLMRLVTQAMIQWEMLEEGDRLLLGLSGGKDSLTLLHVLLEFRKKLPINFEIEVCTIDPMTPSFDPSPLIPYVESLGLKYHYIRDDIVERATNAGKEGSMVSSLCSFCARMKRGHLYQCARKNNCNKLVLAQHLDDLAESFMMSVMHNGFLRTMKGKFRRLI
jgi:selenocysteine lyase/cysteine desulfurase